MNIKTQSKGGGNIRIEPAVDGYESFIGYYTRSDLRNNTAGDAWVCGVNAYTKVGYTIGTGILTNCLNIYVILEMLKCHMVLKQLRLR